MTLVPSTPIQVADSENDRNFVETKPSASRFAVTGVETILDSIVKDRNRSAGLALDLFQETLSRILADTDYQVRCQERLEMRAPNRLPYLGTMKDTDQTRTRHAGGEACEGAVIEMTAQDNVRPTDECAPHCLRSIAELVEARPRLKQ